MNDDIIIVDDLDDLIGENMIVDKPNNPKTLDGDRVRFEDDKMIVTLNKPFTCRYRRSGGIETNEITHELCFRRFRPANGGDLRALSTFRDEEDKTIRLFMRLSGLVEAQFDRIDYADLAFCMEALSDFLLTGRKTGRI